ncbi:MAG TPA: hypothetical protein DCX95_04820, partial [Elusimicrobia bacterium]|nr:hypothetical protein [Elusimicrobiota bacterium]
AAVLAVLSFLRNPKLTVFDKWLIFLVIGFSLSLITSVDCIYTIRVLIGFFLKGIFVAFISDRILKDRVKTTNVILIVCASLIAFVGIVELFFGWHLYYKPGEMPPQIVTSTLGNPLSLAAYLLLFLPLSFLYIENKKSFIKFLPFLFITATILLSFSRSGWIALFFIIVIYFLGKGSLKKKFKNWVHAVSLVFVIVLVFFLIPQLCRNQFKDKFNVKMFSSASFEHRLKSYITTKNILKDYPLFGVGLGNYPKVHEKYMVEGVHKDTPTPDNMYLRFLCDTGIIGAGTFFVFIIYWMYQLWKKRDNPIIWAVFCGLIGFLINQLTADLFLWSATQFAFWMLLGWGVGLTNEKI